MKLLPKLALCGLALGAAVPSFAAEWTEQRFTRDSDEYVVKTAVVGDRTLYRGYIAGQGTQFDLRVRGRNVSGTFNGQQVRFTLPEAEIAAR